MQQSELKSSRVSALLTVRELAKLSGVSASCIYKIEHNKVKANDLTLAKIEKAIINIEARLVALKENK